MAGSNRVVLQSFGSSVRKKSRHHKQRTGRCVYSTYPVALEDLNATLVRAVDGHRSKRSVVVVNTATVHLRRDAVENEAVGRIERDLADTERDQVLIFSVNTSNLSERVKHVPDD